MRLQGHRGLSVQQLSDTAGLSLQMVNVCIITVLTTSWETSPRGNMLIIVIVHGDVVILYVVGDAHKHTYQDYTVHSTPAHLHYYC